jgi:hypothetical protein
VFGADTDSPTPYRKQARTLSLATASSEMCKNEKSFFSSLSGYVYPLTRGDLIRVR